MRTAGRNKASSEEGERQESYSEALEIGLSASFCTPCYPRTHGDDIFETFKNLLLMPAFQQLFDLHRSHALHRTFASAVCIARCFDV